jgi:uncharacterized protein YjbI with pentapeptide repeats
VNIIIDNEIFYNQKILELPNLFSFSFLFNSLIDYEFINFINDVSYRIFNENQLELFSNNLTKFKNLLELYKKYNLNKESFFNNLNEQELNLLKLIDLQDINYILENINKDIEQLVKTKNELKERLLSNVNELIPFEDDKKKNQIEIVLDNPKDIINHFKEKKYYIEDPKKINKVKRIYEKIFASLDPHFKQLVFNNNNLDIFNNYILINFIYDELLNFNVFIEKVKDLLTKIYAEVRQEISDAQISEVLQKEIEEEQIEVKEEQIETKEEQIETKEEQIETKEEQIETKEEQIEVKEEQIEVKEEKIETKEEQIETKEEQIEVKEEQIETKEEQIEVKEEPEEIIEIKEGQIKSEEERIGIKLPIDIDFSVINELENKSDIVQKVDNVDFGIDITKNFDINQEVIIESDYFKEIDLLKELETKELEMKELIDSNKVSIFDSSYDIDNKELLENKSILDNEIGAFKENEIKENLGNIDFQKEIYLEKDFSNQEQLVENIEDSSFISSNLENIFENRDLSEKKEDLELVNSFPFLDNLPTLDNLSSLDNLHAIENIEINLELENVINNTEIVNKEEMVKDSRGSHEVFEDFNKDLLEQNIKQKSQETLDTFLSSDLGNELQNELQLVKIDDSKYLNYKETELKDSLNNLESLEDMDKQIELNINELNIKSSDSGLFKKEEKEIKSEEVRLDYKEDDLFEKERLESQKDKEVLKIRDELIFEEVQKADVDINLNLDISSLDLDSINLDNINLDDINLGDINLDSINLDDINLDSVNLDNKQKEEIKGEELKIEINEFKEIDELNWVQELLIEENLTQEATVSDIQELEKSELNESMKQEELVSEQNELVKFKVDENLSNISKEIFDIINNPKIDGIAIIKGNNMGSYFVSDSIFKDLNLKYISELFSFMRDINNYYEELGKGIIFSWVFKDNVVVIYGKEGLMIGIVKAKLNTINEKLK